MRCLIIVLAALLPAIASAAPAGTGEPAAPRAAPAMAAPATTAPATAAPLKAKAAKAKRVRKDKGYGFLPGYDPPEKADLYGDKYAPYPRYWSRGDFRYGYGGPGFYRGQWNGGGFGPCWTRTPAGPVWNCGQ
jgi:hypothetical protein